MGNRIAISGSHFSASGSTGGYTLIELVVVISLISLLFFFTAPKFQGSFLKDDSRKVARWIMIKVPNLKQTARKTRKLHILHIGIDDGSLWVSDADMTEEEAEAASETAYQLPEDLTIRDITFPDGDIISSGQAEILFYPKGYSDKVLIHIEDDDSNQTSLLIEPFLPKVKYYQEYVEFKN